jgi:hypothetical protein
MKSCRVSLIIVLILAVMGVIQVAPDAEAATVNNLQVRCDQTQVIGNTEVSAPYVRIQIALASNLTKILASEVVPVKSQNDFLHSKGTGVYSAQLSYPRQPEGTLLVIAVGEWDGKQYLKPATMSSRACHADSLPPTPVPSYWEVTTTLISDTCGGASTGATFPVSMTYDDRENITLQRFDMHYFLRPAITHLGYVGEADLGDAIYSLELVFTGPTSFVANESVTFSWSPGCSWEFEWAGTLIG